MAAVRKTLAAISPHTVVAASQWGQQATVEGAVQLRWTLRKSGCSGERLNRVSVFSTAVKINQWQGMINSGRRIRYG